MGYHLRSLFHISLCRCFGDCYQKLASFVVVVLAVAAGLGDLLATASCCDWVCQTLSWYSALLPCCRVGIDPKNAWNLHCLSSLAFPASTSACSCYLSADPVVARRCSDIEFRRIDRPGTDFLLDILSLTYYNRHMQHAVVIHFGSSSSQQVLRVR